MKSYLTSDNMKSACCVIMLIVILGMFIVGGGLSSFSSIDVSDNDSNNDSVNSYVVHMWFEWEDDRHDVEIGDQFVWVECLDNVRGTLEDRVEIVSSTLVYSSVYSYVWAEEDKVRLHIPSWTDWYMHDGNGNTIPNPVVTVGVDAQFYFYEMAVQWNYAVLHVEWFSV